VGTVLVHLLSSLPSTVPTFRVSLVSTLDSVIIGIKINDLEPDLINVVICISVLSIGLSCVYAGSRTLTALAETGFAPRIFAYVDKSSRPLFSVIAGLAFAPLAYINLAPDGEMVFNWLVALSGLSTLFSWLSICLCQCVITRVLISNMITDFSL
jgi:amino acid permease